MSKLCRLALIALPILISGAAAIAAEDEKTFPGAICQPAGSTSLVLRDGPGRMVNTDTSTQFWICPVVRDIMAANGVEFAQIIVMGTAASCIFVSSTETGAMTAVANPTSRIPSSVTIGGQNIGLTILKYADGDPNVSSVANGYYYFGCTIPAGSGVMSYRVSENDSES